MRKANKLVMFSIILTSSLALSSCIFNDEKMFEDEKIQEAITLKESEQEMKLAAVENIYSTVHIALEDEDEGSFPTYSGNYYKYIRSEENPLSVAVSGMYYEPRNNYLEYRMSADSNFITAKKNNDDTITFGGDYYESIKDENVSSGMEEYFETFLIPSFDFYSVFPYAWNLKEGLNIFFNQKGIFDSTGVSVEKNEETENNLLSKLELLTDNGAGYITLKLTQPFDVTPSTESLDEQSKDEYGDLINSIKLSCEYIETTSAS